MKQKDYVAILSRQTIGKQFVDFGDDYNLGELKVVRLILKFSDDTYDYGYKLVPEWEQDQEKAFMNAEVVFEKPRVDVDAFGFNPPRLHKELITIKDLEELLSKNDKTSEEIKFLKSLII